MAQACATCSGVGWLAPGFTDPCPDCTAGFEEYAKTSDAEGYFDKDKGKVVKRTTELTFGEFKPPPQSRNVRTEQVVETGVVREQKDEPVDARAAGFSEAEIERSAR